MGLKESSNLLKKEDSNFSEQESNSLKQNYFLEHRKDTPHSDRLCMFYATVNFPALTNKCKHSHL